MSKIVKSYTLDGWAFISSKDISMYVLVPRKPLLYLPSNVKAKTEINVSLLQIGL